ncbi:MAG: hypothetical protein CVU00_06150 [Bacteroidetes bacterium HGW-Bacteroidetes-17]|jgi:hypothetical protein|nr:MAG: hypothetical protein CVU00_06150 [Bacteroidetes bacterium HGW-Bacteroidetes-17]
MNFDKYLLYVENLFNIDSWWDFILDRTSIYMSALALIFVILTYMSQRRANKTFESQNRLSLLSQQKANDIFEIQNLTSLIFSNVNNIQIKYHYLMEENDTPLREFLNQEFFEIDLELEQDLKTMINDHQMLVDDYLNLVKMLPSYEKKYSILFDRVWSTFDILYREYLDEISSSIDMNIPKLHKREDRYGYQLSLLSNSINELFQLFLDHIKSKK